MRRQRAQVSEADGQVSKSLGLEAVDLGECLARFSRSPLDDWHVWTPTLASSVLLAGTVALTTAGETWWALSLLGLGLLACSWLVSSVRSSLSSFPLIICADGFYYDDGTQKHVVPYAEIVEFRADYRSAHDPRPWTRAYGFFVETGGRSIYVGWGIRHTDRAILLLKKLLPSGVTQDDLR